MEKKYADVEASVKKAGEDLKAMYREAKDPESARKEKPAPYFRVPKHIVEKRFTELTPTQRLIAICIYAHYNSEKGYSWPSWKKMESFVGVSQQTIWRNLPKVLQSCNIRKENVSGKNSRYFVS